MLYMHGGFQHYASTILAANFWQTMHANLLEEVIHLAHAYGQLSSKDKEALVQDMWHPVEAHYQFISQRWKVSESATLKIGVTNQRD